MDNRKTFFSGALSLTVAALIVKIIGVAYKIPMSYILGDEGMGYFNAAYTVYGLFYIITSAGIPKAMAIATASSEDKENGINFPLYKSLVFIFGVFGVILTVLLVAFASPLASLVGSNKSYITLLSIAPSVFFVTVSGVARGYLNGRIKLLPIAISQVIEALSKLIFGIVFAMIGIGLYLPLPIISAFSIFGITIGSFASMVYLLVVAKKSEEKEKIGQSRDFSIKRTLYKLIKIALPITLSSAILSASGVFDLSFLMRGLNDLGYTENAAISLYGNYTTLAVPMITLVASVLAPITVSILPRLVGNLNDLTEWRRIADSSYIITFALALPCALIFLLYSFDILDVLYALFPSAEGAEALSILSIAALLLPLLNLANTFLESRGRVVQTLISLTIGVVVKLALSVIFLFVSGYDLYVVPLTTIISYGVSLIISLVLVSREAGFKPPIVTLYLFVGASISFALPYLLIYTVGYIQNSFFAMIVCIIISLLIYAIIVFSTIKGSVFKDFEVQNAQKNNEPII